MNNGNKIDNMVYDLISNELDKSLRSYLHRYECFKLIENIKFHKCDIVSLIKNKMENYGFTERHIEYFTSDISKRLRFNRMDSREIMHRLQEKGMIKLERNNVYICNGND